MTLPDSGDIETRAAEIEADLRRAADEAAHRARVEQRAAVADELEREVRMYRAGIPMHTTLGEMFASAYDGPLDDADEIQASWFKTIDRRPPDDLRQRITAKRIAKELTRDAR